MDPLALIATALALFTLVALYAAQNLARRLHNLRANCFVTNERGHRTKYAHASPEVRARVEQSA